MRILILGGAGMLGHKLWQCFRTQYDAWVTVRSSFRSYERYGLFDRDRLLTGVDAFDFDAVVRVFASVRPDAVINCIGVIKQLATAKDPLISLTVNSLFPHRLANLCRMAGTRLLHISTDCVFSGRKGRYTEADVSDAEDLYGRSKFLGEVDGPGCLTLRTSIIGRELNTGHGLVGWFLKQRGSSVHGYQKAIYTGFTTLALAQVIGDVLDRHPDLQGLWQVSSNPINKFDLLSLVNDVYGLGIRVQPDNEFVCDRSLDSSRFRTATGIEPPSWREMIEGMHRDQTPYDAWSLT